MSCGTILPRIARSRILDFVLLILVLSISLFCEILSIKFIADFKVLLILSCSLYGGTGIHKVFNIVALIPATVLPVLLTYNCC